MVAPKLVDGEVPGTINGMSPKGWMDQDLFDQWFSHHFVCYASGERSLLLILDGHSSRYNKACIRGGSDYLYPSSKHDPFNSTVGQRSFWPSEGSVARRMSVLPVC